jgi:hypothetical protein
MESFKSYLDEQEMLERLGAQNEALTVQQRLKLKRSIIRNKAKIRMGKKRAERRIANQDVLKKRAMRQARTLMLKRILKNKSKGELSYSQRQTYEKMLSNKKAGIQRLAQKLLPKMRKLELQRKTGGPRSLNLTPSGSPAPKKPAADKSAGQV